MTRTVTFTDNDTNVSIDICIMSDDFWTIAKGYKVHYCEDYNQICVYQDNDTTYQTIYKESI
jgi:hypothetical protein